MPGDSGVADVSMEGSMVQIDEDAVDRDDRDDGHERGMNCW